MKYNIPGTKDFSIDTIILDLNGTLSVGGVIVEGVKERLAKLKSAGFRLILFTGDTRGDADTIAKDLNIEWRLAKTAADKKSLAQNLNPEKCAAIGNGLIDLELVKVVKLSVVTLQAEGVHTKTLLNSDIVVPSIKRCTGSFY